MKKILIVLFLAIILMNSTHALAQWQWAKHIGGNYMPYSERAKVITDGTNSYLIGSCGPTLFMPNDTIYSNGNNDMFISKFDQNGQQLWTKHYGGANSTFMDWEDMNGQFDSINNCIYITGQFYGVATFDTAGTLFSTGATIDIFLAKMDLNGNILWVRKAGGGGEDYSTVYVGVAGEVYLICQSLASATFGNFQLSSGGIIAKYDTNGNCLMAQNKFTISPVGDSNYLFMNFIGRDVLIYGTFATPTFQLDTVKLINKGLNDYFISLCDSNLRVKWIKHFGTAGNEFKGDLSVDKFGNIYAPIHFSDSLRVDSLTFVSASSINILLLKMASNGTLKNVNQIRATGPIYSFTSAIDASNELYVGGSFNGQTSFGGNNTYTSGLPYDFYFAKFDTTLALIGADYFNNASAYNMRLDAMGSIICVGNFQNQVSFGSNNFTSYGSWDLFIGKHDAITGIRHQGKSKSNNKLYIHANPSEGKCNITVPDEFLHEKNLVLSIYNSSGKLIQQKNLEMNEGKIKLSLEAEAKGLYNAVLSNGTKSYSGKIVFE